MKKLNLVLSFLLAMMISFLVGVYAAPHIRLGGLNQTAGTSAAAGKETPVAQENSENTVDSDAGPETTDADSNHADSEGNATSDGDSTDSPDAAVSTGGEIGEPITFNYNVNSAEGIRVTWEGKNLTGKTINYYTAEISTYNRVGDPSYDQHSGESKFLLKYVGPIEPDGDMILFDLFTYQGALHKIVIDKFRIEYSDGTTETIDYGYETTDDSGL